MFYQAADKLFDDIHWLIVHSLKAVQVSSTCTITGMSNKFVGFVNLCICFRMLCPVIVIVLKYMGE